MRTTVDLPEPLLQTAKSLAAEQKTTLSAVVEHALRVFLARKATGGVEHFRLHTVRGRLLHPNLDLDRTSALDVEADELVFAKKLQRHR
jgi:hypothetical protein